MKTESDFMKAAKALIVEGRQLDCEKPENQELGPLNIRYQRWYTKALAVVTMLTPSRGADFAEAYKFNRRRTIQYDTYTISDFLMGVKVTRGGNPCFDINQAYMVKLVKQIGILSAAIDAGPSVLMNLRLAILAELFDSSLNRAKDLMKTQNVRGAGVVCGLVLHQYIRELLDHQTNSTESNPSNLGDAHFLRAHSVLDESTLNLVERLEVVSNSCADSTGSEPSYREVEDLISGTARLTRETFVRSAS